MKRFVTQTVRTAHPSVKNDFGPGTPASRLAMAWPLTREVASLNKSFDVDQQLQRNLVSIIRNKRASGRTKDLADAEALEDLKSSGPDNPLV